MKNIKKYSSGLFLLLLIGLVCFSCKNDDENASLGPLPQADFTITKGDTPNTVLLTNTTHPSSIAYWSTSNGLSGKGDTASIHFIFKGEYEVSLLAVGHGGIDSVSKSVTIDQNDPEACQGTTQGFIAGCSEKTWSLNPDAYAEMVGPGPGDGSYWGNLATEVTGDRKCDFNDEWTFKFNATGDMKFDNKGDFFSENYLGKADNSCGTNDELTATEKPWASGDFHYRIIPDAGTKPEFGRLKVTGLGAHIGLARVTNGADNVDAPVKSITYDIIGMDHKDGYDLLTLTINEGSDDAPLWWTFTLRSK